MSEGYIITSSGDKFCIPRDYEMQKRNYLKAESEGDEGLMLYYEEGFTGWYFVEEV